MSEPLEAKKVMPFFGLLFRDDLLGVDEVFNFLDSYWSLNSDLSFVLEEAKLKSYYEKEMGASDKLKRLWFFGNDIVTRESLVQRKLEANKLEVILKNKYGMTGRVVNIDPGYVALEQVVLSTCKPYGHRILLGDQVYAELTYQFQGGSFYELPWTYPDYSEELVKLSFNHARSYLKDSL